MLRMDRVRSKKCSRPNRSDLGPGRTNSLPVTVPACSLINNIWSNSHKILHRPVVCRQFSGTADPENNKFFRRNACTGTITAQGPPSYCNRAVGSSSPANIKPDKMQTTQHSLIFSWCLWLPKIVCFFTDNTIWQPQGWRCIALCQICELECSRHTQNFLSRSGVACQRMMCWLEFAIELRQFVCL